MKKNRISEFLPSESVFTASQWHQICSKLDDAICDCYREFGEDPDNPSYSSYSAVLSALDAIVAAHMSIAASMLGWDQEVTDEVFVATLHETQRVAKSKAVEVINRYM